MAEKNNEVLQDTITFDIEVGYKDEQGTVHREIELRELAGIDEENISKPDIRQNVGKVITTLISGLVVRIGDITPKTVKSRSKWEKIFRDLPMGDRDKIMLEIRKFSQGNEIELDMKCPSCKQKIKHIVEIDPDIENRPLEVDAFSVPFELPKGVRNKENELCKTGIIRLPNGEDQEQLDSIARKNAGQANTTLLARVIAEIDGYGKVALSDIRNMSVRDRDYLIKLLDESGYGPKFVISFPCPTCSEDVEAGVHPVNFL